MSENILEIKNATKIYKSSNSSFRNIEDFVALDQFSLDIKKSTSTITTIAGESGSGKTTLANLILGFTDLTRGEIFFDGKNLNDMTGADNLNYRKNIQAVFQDPFGVYNPFYRIEHVFDLFIKHFGIAENKNDARELVENSLNLVCLRGEEVL